MMLNDFGGKAVLVTGGTQGIGRAVGLAFGREGARVYLTHRWGSADESELRAAFAAAGAPPPVILEADASRDEDTARVMAVIREQHERLEVLLSNVCVVPKVEDLRELSKRALVKSLEYSAWPLVSHLKEAKKVFGRYPRYAIGSSSDGPDHYYEGYDYVALSKAVMETLGRHLAMRLRDEDCRVNMVRTRNVITASALAIHGADYPEFVKRYADARHFIEPEEVADAVLALASGLLDAFSGQILVVDRGGPFMDSLMRVYRHRAELGL
jgi:NAD(P)-dependent dehydrogenase (short-subunit alcohol dehydrogenase family)